MLGHLNQGGENCDAIIEGGGSEGGERKNARYE